jgi:hypothetical protein
MIVVAIVKAVTVTVRFATSHPITVGINGTAKGPAGPANHTGAVEPALRTGRSKAATQIATAETPADVGCTAACEAAATKPAAVTAPTATASATTATSTGKTTGVKATELGLDFGSPKSTFPAAVNLLPAIVKMETLPS